ncbi:MAG: hypothetical protein NW226_13875 [Microscillaceae bacterium]|nr:hypothetical protein [Microscillaceae bacterium]
MSKENLVSLNIPDADMTAINQAIQTLQDKLLPHLLELNKAEKESIPKMKDKTIAFVTKATEHSEQKPMLVPQYVDVKEMRKDLEAVELFRQLSNSINQIAKGLDDTMTVAGSEAYIAALAFYQSVKVGAKLNVPGAQEVYDDLSVRFPGRSKQKTPPTT